MLTEKVRLPIIVFTIVTVILSLVQVFVHRRMLLADRFFDGGGWVEIFFVALYGAIVFHNMQDPQKVMKWRRVTWTIFTYVFFGQLLIGILVVEQF